ncbi:hypothetical protein WUBG_09664 [Wuchereria bancrofti]|uniref:CMP domain-containing protein n=1 Tax=Wuchereria bancrofti TaxID=6293 RepID=J9AXS8_WUCBA|nr:hypothetical protein WUBG_09664 [Wuchereria bancrofti]
MEEQKNRDRDTTAKYILAVREALQCEREKSLVQVANWKALPFDQITDNLDDTVESLLKDISNHITLKILTKQKVKSKFGLRCRLTRSSIGQE